MTAFEIWMGNFADIAARLATEDPEHLAMLQQGWSWAERVGGPMDGSKQYFVGQPNWQMCFIDPSVDALKYKPGDLEHRYTLSCGPFGVAVYRYAGPFRRTP